MTEANMYYYEEELEPEEVYVPHYIRYQKDLKDEFTTHLSILTGVDYTKPNTVYAHFSEPKEGRNLIPRRYWLGENYCTYKFVDEITAAGKKQLALEYINREIDEFTCLLKDVAPMYFKTEEQEVDFWKESYKSAEERSSIEKLQREEIERLHRQWMIRFRKNLFVGIGLSFLEPNSVEGQALKKLGKKEDPIFEDIFRAKEKATKLVQVLKVQGHLDNDERWVSEFPHVVRLYTALLHQNIIKKAPLTQLGRVFCSRFYIPAGSFSDKTARTETFDEVYDEFVGLIHSI